MKEYRRKFIVLSLGLIAVVLIAVFVGIGIFVYRNTQRELQMTMRQVLAPWAPLDELPRMKPREEELSQNRAESVIVVFCSLRSNEMSVLSNQEGLSEAALTELVHKAKEMPSEYGRIQEENMFYYREQTTETLKLAFLPSSILFSAMLRLFWTFLLIFAAAMLLFYLICRYISGIAVQPLEKAIARETQFVTDISHDLKTPLTVILANNSILRQSPEKRISEQMSWVDSTEDAAQTMLSMVNDMLTLSSMENEKNNLSKEELDLSAAAEKTCLQLDSVAYERGLVLQEEIDGDLRIRGRKDYVSRVFSSLIENALKYEPKGGTVIVALKAEGPSAVFSVHNSSHIPEADLPHIFERFYRVDKARTSHSGFGLGLAIAKQMTESLGGSISVESGDETGTIFQVRFPLAE